MVVRRYGSALLIAITLVAGLALATRPTSAFGSCWLNHFSENYDWGVLNSSGAIDGLMIEGEQAYYFVDWGDGTYDYQEGWASESMSFELGHFYTSGGDYAVYQEIGTFDGLCTADVFSFNVP
jgi:hypothetical protein